MQHFFEFALNHLVLAGIFAALLVAYIVVETLRGGRNVSPQQLSLMVNKEKALVIDLRDPNEFKQGHITGSQNIPYSKIADKGHNLPSDRPVILVCNLGQVAGAAARQLKSQGMAQVYKLDGGISNWKGLSLPLVKK